MPKKDPQQQKRKKKSNKQQETFNKYGKFTQKHIRAVQEYRIKRN